MSKFFSDTDNKFGDNNNNKMYLYTPELIEKKFGEDDNGKKRKKE